MRSEPIHYSIPVSDIPRNTRFYTEVVGCRHLSTVPRGDTPFLVAAGTCLILVKRDPPINPVLDDHGGVHHSFAVAHGEYKALDHLRTHGVELPLRRTGKAACSTAPRLFSRSRRHGVGIYLTSYAGSR